MTKQPVVYIMASKRNGTLYTGVTGDLLARVWQHKNNTTEGFTKKYSIHTLVYVESHEDMLSAIKREKQIKEMAPSMETGTHRTAESYLA